MKAYTPVNNPAGRASTLIKPTRQIEHKEISGKNYPSKQNKKEVYWVPSRLELPPKKYSQIPDMVQKVLEELLGREQKK